MALIYYNHHRTLSKKRPLISIECIVWPPGRAQVAAKPMEGNSQNPNLRV